MGVIVGNISEQNGEIAVEVLDSMSYSYMVYFEKGPNQTIDLDRIVLPDDDWDVDVFQEVIEVRDEAISSLLEETEYELQYTCMEMNQIMTYSANQRLADSETAS